MHLLIVGAGAIGSFLGARLALAGQSVTLIGRPDLVEAARMRGLSLIEPGGTRQVPAIAAATSIEAAFASGAPFDLAFVTVKAYDTANVAAELAALGHPLPPLLTFQNGVGNEETLAATAGARQVLSGAIDTPVSTPAPGEVRVHRARYEIGIAPTGRPSAGEDALGQAAAVLRAAGFAISIFADHRGLKWTKLLMNILANASCAILDWTPAQVMADPGTARLEARAWQEALAVMAGLHIQPVALAGYPFPVFAPLARRLPPAWLARALGGFVAGGRGSKMPSLHIALSSGRPTEVPWLNGAIARHGVALGQGTPVNTGLTNILVALARGENSWDRYRGNPERLCAAVT